MPPLLLHDEWLRDLSTDAKYLYRMANAISEGSCSADLANSKPGPIAHSRWLTKASRILRLYVTTRNPSNNLKILAEYVVKVYVPMYFNIKYFSSVIYGSPLLSKFIHFTKYLPSYLREIIYPVIQHNSYFAHPENVLLAMLFDDRESIRHLAIKKIMHYRDQLHDPTKLREYKKFKINFDCLDYVDMIDLHDDNILSEPPFTKNIPYDYLKEYLELDTLPISDPKIPCHIQGTERCIQLLTTVSRRVTAKNREAVMGVTIESRKKIPRLESKQDLKVFDN